MENQINGGNIVSLKSDGHKMTVEFVENKYASCIWLNGHCIERVKIHVDALEKIK